MMTQSTCSKSLFGIVLFLSLAANVFFGGMFVGKHIYGAPPSAQKIGMLIKAFKGLSDESKQNALAVVDKDWPAVQEQLRAVRDKRDAVKKILVQENYSEEELDKALAAVRTQVDKLMDAGQTLGKNALGSITPEERIKLIKKLPRPPAE